MTEKDLLTALQNAGADASVAEIIRRNDLAETPKGRKTLSSLLCKLRDKGLATSYQQDGINYWCPTEAGWKALGRDIPADTAAAETAPESTENQPIEPDILPDISPEGAPTAEPARFTYEPDDEVTPALVQESFRVRAVAPFPRVSDALFVLDTLSIAYCDGMPAYQEEIERIADYLRRAAA